MWPRSYYKNPDYEARAQRALAFEQRIRTSLEGTRFTVLQNGWPDFLAVGDDDIFAVECKSGSGRLKEDQIKMHEALEMAGLDVYTVYDDDKYPTPFHIRIRENM